MGKKCNKCKCVKPPRSHHCSTCERCVLKMDHHCPWMNNCVGLTNQKSFILFNFYTMVTAAWTLIRVSIAAGACMSNDQCTTFGGGLIVFVGIVLFMCGIFAIFCAIMFCDQVKLIMEDTSTIDRKQSAKASKQNISPRPSAEKILSSDRPKTRCCSKRSCSFFFFLPCPFGVDQSVEN